jgi:hypothetical protein
MQQLPLLAMYCPASLGRRESEAERRDRCGPDLPNGFISAMYQRKVRLEADVHYENLEELGKLRRELKYQGEPTKKCARSSRTMRKSGMQNAFRVDARPTAMVRSASSTFYRAVLSRFKASAEDSSFPLFREWCEHC